MNSPPYWWTSLSTVGWIRADAEANVTLSKMSCPTCLHMSYVPSPSMSRYCYVQATESISSMSRVQVCPDTIMPKPTESMVYMFPSPCMTWQVSGDCSELEPPRLQPTFSFGRLLLQGTVKVLMLSVLRDESQIKATAKWCPSLYAMCDEEVYHVLILDAMSTTDDAPQLWPS